jgi:probable rRNA maturation factor
LPVRLSIERGPHAGVVRAALKKRSEAMLACLQLKKEEFSLVLSDDDQLKELNKVYRGKNKPTDVLSFPMREGDFARLHATLPSALLGDVIVSVEAARKQAKEASRPLLDELTMLIAHGLLHLLGWDHDTKAKDVKMRAETERLCQAANAADRSPRRSRSAPKGTKTPSLKKTVLKKTVLKKTIKKQSQRNATAKSLQRKQPRRP